MPGGKKELATGFPASADWSVRYMQNPCNAYIYVCVVWSEIFVNGLSGAAEAAQSIIPYLACMYHYKWEHGEKPRLLDLYPPHAGSDAV